MSRCDQEWMRRVVEETGTRPRSDPATSNVFSSRSILAPGSSYRTMRVLAGSVDPRMRWRWARVMWSYPHTMTVR